MLENAIRFTLIPAGLIAFGIALRKPPVIEWLLIFFLKAFISCITDSFLVAYHFLSYPNRMFPRVFGISMLFDLLIFPLLCVYFNQTSLNARLPYIVLQSLLYSAGVCLLEVWAETHTQLIHYERWNVWLSFLYLNVTFLFVRAILAWLRKVDRPT